MAIRFTAREVGVEEEPELECLTAGLAEGTDGSGMVLMFMCSTCEPDDQDVALGMDTYCVVTADQGTAYGAVNEITLHEKLLRVVVAPDALDALSLSDPEIEAVLQVSDESIEQLRSGLRRILTYGRVDARPSIMNLN
ncbi:Imm10 family immunity protein [Sphaerisporangium sp. NPDC051017]|uniref:Imm10 family immunity protein n=1 Tax=Sphaerisporangium sp. NPDC051017 TaxID=3154636 RepID=UPI003432C323